MSAKVESLQGVSGRSSGHGSIAWWMAGAVGVLVVAAIAGSAFMDRGSDTAGHGAGGEIAAVEVGAQLTPQLTAMARDGVPAVSSSR